jgi:hypothetical protein
MTLNEDRAATRAAEVTIEGRSRRVKPGPAFRNAKVRLRDEADANERAPRGALAHTAMADSLEVVHVIDFVTDATAGTASHERAKGLHGVYSVLTNSADF